MSDEAPITELDIGNYYGNLAIKREGDAYFWSIENHNGHNWKPISKPLYEALMLETRGDS